MDYRTLGTTDIHVSSICLGSMTFGEQNTASEAHAQMDMAIERGVNFFDAAEIYPVPPKADTYTKTETIIGNWFAKRGRRDDVVLATKVCGPGEIFSYIRDGKPRLDRENIEAAVDDSLRRLQTDFVDLYQVHWPNRATNYFGKLGYRYEADEDELAIEETLAVLHDLIQVGKVRSIGVSNETPWGVMRYLQLSEGGALPRIACIQNPYNLLNRTFEIGLSEFAHREQVGLLAYSPLGFGVLSGKYLGGKRPSGARLSLFKRFGRYTRAEGEVATRAYVELAQGHGLDPAQMALAFVHSRPFITSTIIGATTLEQLDQNLNSADIKLSEEVLAEIDKIHEHNSNPCP